MITFRMRPRFELRVPFSASEAIERLDAQLKKSVCPCTGELAGNHLHLNICRQEQRIWSPHLNLEIVDNEGGATIHGHFGPRPDIWTLAMALYAICGFLALMGLMFAFSQWSLGMATWSLWVVGGSVSLGLLVYGLALVGQVLSQDQMDTLLHYVEEAEGIQG